MMMRVTPKIMWGESVGNRTEIACDECDREFPALVKVGGRNDDWHEDHGPYVLICGECLMKAAALAVAAP